MADKIIGLDGQKAGQMAPGQQDCIDLLEKCLADAKAGRITTIGVVACGHSDFGTAMAGPDGARLFLGTAILADTVKGAIMMPRAGSPILRPGGRRG